MDKKYITENEIDIKYLRNQLSPEELEAFEMYLMENPEMVDDLTINSVLIENIPKVDNKPSESLVSKLFQWKVRSKDIKVGATAFAFGMVAMNLFVTSTSTDKQSMQVLTINQVRSASPSAFAPSLELDRDAKSNEQFVLLLDVSPERSGPYFVSVYRKSDDKQSDISRDAITSYTLPATNSDGYLGVSLVKKNYTSGTYEIVLKHQRNSAEQYRYNFILKN